MSSVDSGEPSTSSSLLTRVRQNDEDAWRRFVQLYGPLVYRWSRECGVQSSDAADITQDVFRVVLTRLQSLRLKRPGDRFRGWLWTVTRNKLRDYFRRSAARAESATGGTDAQRRLGQIADEMSNESDLSGINAQDGLVQRALELIRGEFEVQTWQAFWRATISGHTAGDIAEDLGMSKGAVRQAKYRVLRRLRQELDEIE